MLDHGGRLRQAASRYGIPLSNWLDLSTGINPNGWPVPAIPPECWQRLPEDDDDLLPAARRYYQNDSLLAVAGSQAAIQALPKLRPQSKVGVMHPAYAEHAANWYRAGHELTVVDEQNIDQQIEQLEALILINPNNPTGKLWSRQQLLGWHQTLAARGGWLVVDEAFMDGDSEHSLSGLPVRNGLIVLRSIGKFFGLAGLRCGFVITEASLLEQLNEYLGPWSLGSPSRFVAAKALADIPWQRATAASLSAQGKRLEALLGASGWAPAGGTPLFQWLKFERAAELHHRLASQGILTRLFDTPASIRFGLPKDEAAWQRLDQAMNQRTIQELRAFA